MRYIETDFDAEIGEYLKAVVFDKKLEKIRKENFMIQDAVNRISYDGNGIATEFAYPFSITTTNDVKVMLVDANGTETILTNDYYVDEANSKVDYPGYPPGEEPLPELQPPILTDGQRIVLYRELDVTQLTSLFDQYPFKTIELMIDKTTILLQQLQDAQQRALTLSVSTGTDVSPILPAPSPNKTFKWAADGKSLVLTDDPAVVYEVAVNLYAAVQAAGDETLGYKNAAQSSAEAAAQWAAVIDPDAYEPTLGSPDVDGKVLSSTTAGERSDISNGRP